MKLCFTHGMVYTHCAYFLEVKCTLFICVFIHSCYSCVCMQPVVLYTFYIGDLFQFVQWCIKFLARNSDVISLHLKN